MKHTIEDERTRGLKRQVRGEAYLLTAALLLVSLFWKTYGLGLPVTACLTELVVLLVGVVYLAVRSTLVSYEFVDPSKAGRRLRALAVVAISAVVAVANAVRNWNTYGDRYTGLLDGHFLAVPVVTFLACGALLSLAFFALGRASSAGQKRLERQMKDEDEYPKNTPAAGGLPSHGSRGIVV